MGRGRLKRAQAGSVKAAMGRIVANLPAFAFWDQLPNSRPGTSTIKMSASPSAVLSTPAQTPALPLAMAHGPPCTGRHCGRPCRTPQVRRVESQRAADVSAASSASVSFSLLISRRRGIREQGIIFAVCALLEFCRVGGNLGVLFAAP